MNISQTRRLTLPLMIVTLLLLTACEPKSDFSYSDGSNGSYEQLSGKWLLINYWAEWCKPCIKEIPELNAVALNDKVRVIGINFDSLPLADEQAIIKKLDIRFPVARSPAHLHYGYPIPNALPTTIVINPEGKVHAILQGPQTAESLTQSISQ